MTVNNGIMLALMRGEFSESPPPAELPPTAVLEKQGTAGKLERNTDKSLDKSAEILDIPLDPDSPQYGSVLRAQTMVVNTTLSTQLKVDESALRQQQLDRMPALLAEINRIAAGLPPMPERVIEGGLKDT